MTAAVVLGPADHVLLALGEAADRAVAGELARELAVLADRYGRAVAGQAVGGQGAARAAGAAVADDAGGEQ